MYLSPCNGHLTDPGRRPSACSKLDTWCWKNAKMRKGKDPGTMHRPASRIDCAPLPRNYDRFSIHSYNPRNPVPRCVRLRCVTVVGASTDRLPLDTASSDWIVSGSSIGQFVHWSHAGLELGFPVRFSVINDSQPMPEICRRPWEYPDSGNEFYPGNPVPSPCASCRDGDPYYHQKLGNKPG